MVDKYTKEKKYDYDINANKVVNNDRDAPQRDNEPNGEPETLVGKQLHKFGDLAIREKPPIPKRTHQKTNLKKFKKPKHPPDISPQLPHFNSSENEPLIYKPKTKDTASLYEELLNLIHKFLIDQTSNEIKSAVDSIICISKDENIKEIEKSNKIEEILGIISQEEKNKIYQLCKGLIDFESDINNIDDIGTKREIEMNIEFEENDINEEENIEDIEMENRDNEIEDKDINEQNIQGNENIDERTEKDKNNRNDLLNEDAVLQNPYWLQIFLREKLNIDDSIVLKTENDIMNILKIDNIGEIENKLVMMLKRENFEFIKFLLLNKDLIYYSSKLGRSQKEEKDTIILEMCSKKEGYILYDKIKNYMKIKKKTSSLLDSTISNIVGLKKEEITTEIKTVYNLDDLKFTEGNHFNSNKKIILPKGTFKQTKQGYEEIYIPPIVRKASSINEIPIKSLPQWMHKAFQKLDENNNYTFINDNFNMVQSKVLNTALYTDENLLICAPTSSGKTNIAMMTILNILNKYRNESTNAINTKHFKIVYIAPMKALVKETVGNFSLRLSSYNINVKELSGDINLSKHEIENTTVIVTTPEKWDIITRKAGEKTFTEKVQLLIIDEIHLLHDTRGPVLESIIARTIRNSFHSKDNIRIVALSATLPNYRDVSDFCHVDAKKGLFFFDNSYRPIPLEQLYIGITEKKGIKKMLLLNQITYDKVTERLMQNKQIIIFVHSRKETIRTAKGLIELAKQKSETQKFSLSENKKVEFKVILDSDLSNNMIKDKQLIELFHYGIGVHHAGMSRGDKEIVEEYFNNGYLNIIVSTATLAWGVNLPAHTVIIKGTQVYSPDEGKWSELSHLDIMQMMGRAGRVGYTKSVGEGIIITTFNELQYYLSLLNQQLPIESQLISFLPDALNAEIAAGSIANIKEAVNWLSYTYLYIRMLRAPNVYTINDTTLNEDPYLIKRRTDLIHSSALLLDKQGLIKYNMQSEEFSSTQLGKISSYYYIKYQSIGIYNQHLHSHMNIIDLFQLFSLSNEFKLIPIREEEKKEVEKLLQKVPIPIKGSIDDPSSKINILLQAFISNISLESYAISSDMIFISQNASRIFRALFEICVKRAWATVSQICLNICKMIKLRMWSSMSPLRQFGIIPNDILHKIESKEQLTWERFYDLSAIQISELIKINKKNSEGIHKLIHTFPRIDLTANIQPLTRNCIFVELIITPNFKWNSNYHKHCELFHIFVEDNDSEVILHYETFGLKQKDINYNNNNNDYQQNEKRITFIVPLIEPLPPQYFIRVISDNWLNCEKLLAIYFKHLILPEKFPPYTNLLELFPLNYNGLVSNFGNLEKYYNKHFKTMNSIQTQCFKMIYETNNSVFIGATAGNGKSQIAEYAIIKHLTENKKLNAPIIYICSNNDTVDEQYAHLNKLFPMVKINKFTGEYTIDSNLFDISNIIISSFVNIDYFTRKIKKKKNFKEIQLVIVNDIHLIGENQCSLEMALTRMRYTNKNIRYIILGTSLSNPNSICDWLNIDINSCCFNFNPNIRQNKIEIFFYGYDSISHKARFNLMLKPVIQLINKHSFINNYPLSTIVYVSDIKRAKILLLEYLSYVKVENYWEKSVKSNIPEYEKMINENMKDTDDNILLQGLLNGIGYIHELMREEERNFIIDLYKERILHILIITYKMIWKINSMCHVVIIADPVKYNVNNGGWSDYNINDMLQIMGKASITYNDNTSKIPPDVISAPRKCLIFFQNSKKEFFKKFLLESYPLESQLNHYLHNNLVVEISNGIIKNKQNCVDWMTWTYLYHRLLQNPNYYDMKGKTNADLNEYLSEMIEEILNDLVQAQCISISNEGEIIPLNLGKISSFYCVSYSTIDLFNQSFNENSNKLSEMFQILKNSYEFDEIELNKGDIEILYELSSKIPQAYLGNDIKTALKSPQLISSSITFSDPHNKALILLLCYLSRLSLPSDMHKSLEEIVILSSRIVLSIVDVLSSKQFLKPALLAMELSQMIIQGMWITQSPLMQLPWFNKEICQTLKENNVEDIADFMNMEDEERNSILNFTHEQIVEIAQVCNRYPNITMNANVVNSIVKEGEIVNVVVELVRDIDDKEKNLSQVFTLYYPHVKEEAWWVIIGDEENNMLKVIKRASFFKALKINFAFAAPEKEGKYSYKVYLFCDSWIGCDMDENINFEVTS